VKEIFFSEGKKRSLRSIVKYNPEAVVTIGNPASLWAKTKISKIPVIVVSGIIYQIDPQGFKQVVGVAIDFPIQAYLELIQESFPEAKRVGTLFNSSTYDTMLSESEKAAKTVNLQIFVEPVKGVKEVGHALHSLTEKKVDVFLMCYNPLLMNPESFKYLVDFCAIRKIGLVVPSKALLTKGGVLSV